MALERKLQTGDYKWTWVNLTLNKEKNGGEKQRKEKGDKRREEGQQGMLGGKGRKGKGEGHEGIEKEETKQSSAHFASLVLHSSLELTRMNHSVEGQ